MLLKVTSDTLQLFASVFHLVPRCNIGVLNTSLVTIKNISVIAHINNEEKIYNLQQYLPLAEGIGICYQGEKGQSNIFPWLKQYYFLENSLSLTLLSISIILELLLLIVYLIWKKVRKVPEKNLIAFCISLLMSDITVSILSLMRKNINVELCKMLAVLLHFLSLALCTWPCIIAYELWAIRRSRNTRKGQNTLYLV